MIQLFIADAHLDLSYNAILRGRDVTRPAAEQPVADNEIATVGFPDLRKGGVGLVCATIFCSPKRENRPKGYVTADEAHAQAMAQWDWYRKQIDADELRLVRTKADLPQPQPSKPAKPISNPRLEISDFQREIEAQKSQIANRKSQIPIILLMEGGDAFRSSDEVSWWFDQGLRMIGLAWRKTRMAGGTGFPGPISDEGRAIVKAMDKLGMIHDCSHLADESFWQLLEMTGGPVCASHSNCRAIVPGDRQISDEMIKALAGRGGVIGMNFYDQFLMPPEQYRKRRCALSDLLAHIQRICDLLGDAKHVGLGTDMDGGVGRDDIPCEIATAGDLPRVADALNAAGFSDEDVLAIMGRNWLEFFGRYLPHQSGQGLTPGAQR
jgi:membrane dipeptidase